MGGRYWCAWGALVLVTACASSGVPRNSSPSTTGPIGSGGASVTAVSTIATGPAATTTTSSSSPSSSPLATSPSITSTSASTTTLAPATSTTVAPTTEPATTTTAPATTIAPPVLASSTSAAVAPPALAARTSAVADVSMTSVPADLILPTGDDTLVKPTNPINGRRGGAHPLAGAPTCIVDPSDPTPCLVVTLDALGFDVTGGRPADQARHRRQAVAVLQLDAGLASTGEVDEALLGYLGILPGTETAGADEVRVIGTSAGGRPITALRYGSGPRMMLVVAQTHGDEEAGLRVWMRARRTPVPAGTTVWVVPMLNPDGLALDTRFLANGTDPNRAAPAQPEQKAVFDLAVAIRPTLSVWYHQNYGWIGWSGADKRPGQLYHDLTRLGPLYQSGDCKHGFMWCPVDEAVGGSSILVELPDIVTPADVQRHAAALLTVAGTP